MSLRTIVVMLTAAMSVTAHEYPLQYTAAVNARGLVVAGYQLTATSVIGNCSYYTVSSGSGKGGGYRTTTTYYNHTCTWDLTGNLLSVASGAPAAPPVLYVSGTRTVYASNGTSTAGTDSALSPYRGYVDTPTPHYTWAPFTPPPGPAAQNIALTLTSDGDQPLDVISVTESTAIATSRLVTTDCVNALAVGSSCSITIYYDPSRLASPSGLMYETLTVTVGSNSPQPSVFSSRFTIRVRVGEAED